MPLTMLTDKVTVCKPIESLIKELTDNGFEVIESKVKDYHFHELYFKLKGIDSAKLNSIVINDIKKIDNNTFSCLCHWSIVELIFIDD